MADVSRSSFIPKQTPGSVPSRVRKKKRFHALAYSANVLLIASLALAGGTYFYKDYLKASLESEKLALADERDRFNEADIASVRELDYKLSIAELLLDTHLSPSKLFDTLELTTKKSVQFIEFSFEQLPSQNITLSVRGGTEELKSVAVQALQFWDDPLLSGALFTEIGNRTPSVEEIERGPSNQEPEYAVNFTVSGSLAAGSLVYDGTATPVDVAAPAESTFEEPVGADGDGVGTE